MANNTREADQYDIGLELEARDEAERADYERNKAHDERNKEIVEMAALKKRIAEGDQKMEELEESKMKITDDGHIMCEDCDGSGVETDGVWICQRCHRTGQRLPHLTDLLLMLDKILKKLDKMDGGG